MRVESSHQIGCLGVPLPLDNRQLRDGQVEKAIIELRKVLQAVKVVRKYFSTEETVKLIMATMFFQDCIMQVKPGCCQH